MPVETNYAPKYVDLEDVPVAGPDNYSDGAKRKAMFEAEATLELDTNDGMEILDHEITSAHRAAAMNLGTHILTHSAGSPDDITLGDMSDSGGQSMDYASKYLERYERMVEKINATAQGAKDSRNVSVSTNTRDSSAMSHKYPYRRDDRFPDN